MRFSELRTLLLALDWIEREGKGSHTKFTNRRGYTISVPQKSKMVKQVYLDHILEEIERGVGEQTTHSEEAILGTRQDDRSYETPKRRRREEVDNVSTAIEELSREYSFIAKADLVSGGWVIIYPDLPGCITQADTYEEIGDMAKDAFETWVEAQIEDGRPIPQPSDFSVPGWDWEAVGEPLMTTKEVAEELNVTPRRVLAIAKSRRLGRKFGKSVMFRRSDVTNLMPGSIGRPRQLAH